MYHVDDFIDGFSVLFGDGNVVFPKRSLPLGAATVDILNLPEKTLEQLQSLGWELDRELTAYFSGDYDPTQAALTNQALKKYFSLLSRLPVYRELEMKEAPSVSSLRRDPEAWERMRTQGTEEYAFMQTWRQRLHALVPTLRAFRHRAEKLLTERFAKVTERSPSGYAKCIAAYKDFVGWEYHFASDALDQEDVHGRAFEQMRTDYEQELERQYFPSHFPIEVSYRAMPHPKNEGEYVLAEEVFFKDIGSFLSLDLMRGFIAGHLPRRCEHCGKWFLLESGHDTRYCENPAPGEPGKTCRQVGAHRKEARLNGTVAIRSEYMRVTNRLKGQKFRGTLSVDDWNDYMRQVQDLRDDAIAGRIKLAELKKRYDAISARRVKQK